MDGQINTENTRVNPKTLFKDWTRFTNNTNGLKTEFDQYELIAREDDWHEISNIKSQTIEEQHLQKYAAGEYWAHELAYKDLPEISIEQILEENGTSREFRCERLKTHNEGLVCYILTPTNVNPNESPDIRVIFKGTVPKCNASVLRDVELRGAGSLSFAAHATSILSQLNQTIKQFNQAKNPNQMPLSITFAGHSLGGADAQNALNATMNALCKVHGLEANEPARVPCPAPEDLAELTQVNKLRLFTYNAAGVPSFTAKECEASAALLAKLRAQDGSPKIQIECYNQRIGGDGVQQTGEAHILNNVAPEHAKVDVLKAHIGQEHRHKMSLPAAVAAIATGTAVAGVVGFLISTGAIAVSSIIGLIDTGAAHTKKVFKEPIKAAYERMDNSTPEGQKQVHAELSKKSWWLNTFHKGAGMLLGFERHKKAEKAAKINEDFKQIAPNSDDAVTPEAPLNVVQHLSQRKAKV